MPRREPTRCGRYCRSPRCAPPVRPTRDESDAPRRVPPRSPGIVLVLSEGVGGSRRGAADRRGGGQGVSGGRWSVAHDGAHPQASSLTIMRLQTIGSTQLRSSGFLSARKSPASSRVLLSGRAGATARHCELAPVLGVGAGVGGGGSDQVCGVLSAAGVEACAARRARWISARCLSVHR